MLILHLLLLIHNPFKVQHLQSRGSLVLFFFMIASGCYHGSGNPSDDSNADGETDRGGEEEFAGDGEDALQPCVVTWVIPQDGFNWVREDDQVGDPGDGFQHAVEVSLDLEDGHPLYLWVNNNTLAAVTVVQDRRARFENVSFPTDGELELRVDSTMMGSITPELEDRTCGSWIRGSIVLGLPDCRMEVSSAADWMNLGVDMDPSAPWIQTEVIAYSYDASIAELYIDGVPGDSPARTADFVDEAVTFESVTMEDAAYGGRCLQVGCLDAAGNRGFSTRNCFGVDSIAPAMEIIQPTQGASFDDSSDVSAEYSGVEIGVEVDTDQPHSLVEIGHDDCSWVVDVHLLEELVWTDASGHASGLTHLGDLDGDYTICAKVTRVSGNAAADSVTVRFDTAVPALKIARPNGTVPEDPADNAANDSLILMVEDEIPYDPVTNPDHTCEFTVLVDCELLTEDADLHYRVGPDPGPILGTSPCLPCSGLEDPPCSLSGRAVFSRQVLQDLWWGLYANQGAFYSPDVAVVIDMLPASPEITDPVCGTSLSLPAPFAARISVETERDGSDVTLNVSDGSGNPLAGSPYIRANIDGQSVFESVALVEGENVLEACAADSHGQFGCGPRCTLTVDAR